MQKVFRIGDTLFTFEGSKEEGSLLIRQWVGLGLWLVGLGLWWLGLFLLLWLYGWPGLLWLLTWPTRSWGRTPTSKIAVIVLRCQTAHTRDRVAASVRHRRS
jgi:hypothetical protein